jgi:predicted NACHT family NTPase
MVFSELALGYLTNLIYDSSKKIPKEISDTYSKVYEKAIKEFSDKHYKLNGIQIDTFFHQENVEIAIRKYLKNPDKLDCSNVLIQEFFELFREQDFSHENAHLILNTFFEILDTKIEEYPELIVYLDHYLVKRTDKTAQETKQGVQELSQDFKEISQKVNEIHKVVNEGREDQSRKELDADFEESIKKYLNKIIDEEGRTGISEVYTELSAKEILPITLKFRDEENVEPKEFEVLELVEKEEKLIVSGESGSGKTITLKWLNFIYATNYLEKKEGTIPLYVELNTYIEGSFYDYVKIKANRKGITEELLKTMFKGKSIILIDGMDLLSPRNDFHPYDQISNFISKYSNCRFVISSRPGFFEGIGSDFKVLELEKLTDKKIQVFIEKRVKDSDLKAVLIDKILNDHQLKSLLTNPMLLYLAIKVAERKKEDLLLSNRSELYSAFISGLFFHYEKTKVKTLCANRVEIKNALKELYFKLQSRNEVSCEYDKALETIEMHCKDLKLEEKTSQCILEDCFKLGLLIKKDSETEETKVEYGIHQSFQEYFAAIRLKELFECGFDVSEAFSHPKWEEVVIFASEMMNSDSNDKFIDSMLSKGELFLASKCVSKASEKIKEKLCALLADKLDSGYKLEKINSIKSLERIGIIGGSIIAKALKDKNRSVRCKAAEVLGDVEFEEAVDSLIFSLSDEYEDVREEAAIALGKIRSEKAVESLIYLLKNEYALYVRLGAIFALGEIKVEKAVEALVHALNDEDEDVRVYAIEKLREIKPEMNWEKMSFIPMDEENIDFLDEMAIEIGISNSEMLVETPICALKDEDRYIRLGTTEKFRGINPEEIIERLFKLLKDNDEDMGWWAALSLGNLMLERAVDPLISALNDKDVNMRAYAAQSLGKISSEKAIEPLINVLQDESEFVRGFVAEALGNICTVKNRARLEDLLASEHEFSVNTAFEILYEIDRKEKSELILFKDLKKRSEIIPKYSIFVSSVQKELENERVTIQELVGNDPLLSEHYISLLYEYEPAYPEKTLEGCLNALNRCQVYLLIVGMKYGTLVGDISITHTEYRYAKEKNLPILVFIKGERNIEREQGTEVLLKEIESDDFKYKRFWNVKDLKNEVNESLKKLLQEEDKFLKI